jgi:hypothetical protein
MHCPFRTIVGEGLLPVAVGCYAMPLKGTCNPTVKSLAKIIF